MPSPQPLVRVVDEFLWSLRRDGFSISTAQAIDALRAVAAVGLQRPAEVRDAIAAVVVDRAAERPRFDASFSAFFGASPSAHSPPGSLWDRLSALGFDDVELGTLRALFEQLALADTGAVSTLTSLLGGGADLHRALVLAGIARTVDAQSGPQLGFLSHRLLSQIGAPRARQALAALRTLLSDALGGRGEELAAALAQELERSSDAVRAFVRRTHEARARDLEAAADRLETTPFASLSASEVEEVRRAVRRFAERLRGSARVRMRHARRGRIDPHRSLQRALRTGGIPFQPVYRRRRRDRPKLLLVCDVSDSVRAVAGFLLEFVYAAQELFAKARSFVFVSELGETTALFAREPVQVAIACAWGGGVVRASDNSNYGRVLRTFEARYLGEIDRRTTVVFLGDGRNNYLDAAPEVLKRIRARCRALLWLCPEGRAQWSEGDSAMALYEPECSAVYEVRCAADLERAARVLVRGV